MFAQLPPFSYKNIALGAAAICAASALQYKFQYNVALNGATIESAGGAIFALVASSLGKVAFDICGGSNAFLAGTVLAGSAALSYVLIYDRRFAKITKAAKEGDLVAASSTLSGAAVLGIAGGLAAHALAKAGGAVASMVR